MKHTPIDLDDCGKVVDVYHRNLGYYFRTRIDMVIKAPRGTLVIYEGNRHTIENDKKKGQAIKAFVRAYRDG